MRSSWPRIAILRGEFAMKDGTITVTDGAITIDGGVVSFPGDSVLFENHELLVMREADMPCEADTWGDEDAASEAEGTISITISECEPTADGPAEPAAISSNPDATCNAAESTHGSGGPAFFDDVEVTFGRLEDSELPF